MICSDKVFQVVPPNRRSKDTGYQACLSLAMKMQNFKVDQRHSKTCFLLPATSHTDWHTACSVQWMALQLCLIVGMHQGLKDGHEEFLHGLLLQHLLWAMGQQQANPCEASDLHRHQSISRIWWIGTPPIHRRPQPVTEFLHQVIHRETITQSGR